jgi:hypothetical protein
MNIETLKKLKETLGTKEVNQLIGEICRAYEFLRYNGTEKQVQKIYGTIEPNYISEKTAKYFDSGSGFASNLSSCYLSNLGKVLIDEIESGDLISIS